MEHHPKAAPSSRQSPEKASTQTDRQTNKQKRTTNSRRERIDNDPPPLAGHQANRKGERERGVARSETVRDATSPERWSEM